MNSIFSWQSRFWGGRGRKWILGFLCMLVSLPVSILAGEPDREVVVNTPAQVRTGLPLEVTVMARTQVGNGEQVGFMHAQYSLDGGKKWEWFCSESDLGPTASRSVTITAGSSGSTILVRVQVAFRGGLAGDVDYRGATIQWKQDWDKWEGACAIHRAIKVVAH